MLLQPRLHHHHPPPLPPQTCFQKHAMKSKLTQSHIGKILGFPQATPHRSDRVSSTRGFGAAANLNARLVPHRQQHSSRRHSTGPLSRSTDHRQPAQGSCPFPNSVGESSLGLAGWQRLVAGRWSVMLAQHTSRWGAAVCTGTLHQRDPALAPRPRAGARTCPPRPDIRPSGLGV